MLRCRDILGEKWGVYLSTIIFRPSYSSDLGLFFERDHTLLLLVAVTRSAGFAIASLESIVLDDTRAWRAILADSSDPELMMPRDILYLLKADFADGPGQPYYCPDCAQVTGVLAYFPQLRYQLDVRYVDYQRPRTEIVELIGAQNQGCPVLILADAPFPQASEWITGEHQGRKFISGAKAITSYWSMAHQVSRPH